MEQDKVLPLASTYVATEAEKVVKLNEFKEKIQGRIIIFE